MLGLNLHKSQLFPTSASDRLNKCSVVSSFRNTFTEFLTGIPISQSMLACSCNLRIAVPGHSHSHSLPVIYQFNLLWVPICRKISLTLLMCRVNSIKTIAHAHMANSFHPLHARAFKYFIEGHCSFGRTSDLGINGLLILSAISLINVNWLCRGIRSHHGMLIDPSLPVSQSVS